MEKEITSNSNRLYNIDILRIIAMIMVVSLHVLGKGKFMSDINNEHFYTIMLLIETICIVTINCYILITGYFQVESKFKAKKVIKIWIKVIFYSIVIYIFLLLLGQVNFSLKDCIKSFFPILTNEYWFVNCYLLLYILSPFINKLIKQLDKKEFQKLLIILLIVFCILPSILPSSFTFDKTRGYGIIWFVVLYLVGAYIRLYVKSHYKNRINLFCYVIVTGIAYLLILLIKYICNKFQISDMSTRLYNYNFITVFLASVFLFLYFKNINVKNLKVINMVSKIAPLTFAVYIIHEQVVLRGIMYLDILNLDQIWNNPIQLIIIPVTVIGIFLVCILIEKFTKNTIQKYIYNVLEKIYLRTKKNKYFQNYKSKILQK